MADIFDKAKRSEIMKKVRSKNNKSTELKLIHIFKENNIHGWLETIMSKVILILYFLTRKLQFLSTDAFGTVMIAEIQNRKIIRNIGIKSENET